ncbi:hypothetical protein L6164_035370 [Bauhinia variegata]|uniref:Uncharacterized protein n=1 Tax=Bauhinia variegata TaxID=167791 RepID=A0ACB9KDR6_BAUVA|nr:hypothetical protein L6164_035370 [Bauhinia variegata]
MDFHRLSRKELQTLCKKNKIPANMTNVAMADALEALQQVEGLDEVLNPVESDYTEQFPDEKVVGTPQIHRTACRTSTRKKPVTVEPETLKVSTRLRRGTRAGNAEGNDQENKDLNVPATPVMPSSRTRASAISTRRKKESHMKEDVNIENIDVPKTPAAPPSSRIRGAGRSVSRKLETTGGTAVQCTRRSMRLLEKGLADMSLMDTEDTEHEKNDEISEEMTNVLQQNHDSAKTKIVSDAGTNLQTPSAVDSETSDGEKATSQEKNNGCECQPQESQSEVQLGSEVGVGSVDVGAGLSFEVENSIDSSNPENKFCSDAMQDLPVGTTDDASPDVTEQEITGSLAVSSPDTDSVIPEGLVESSTYFSNPDCSDALQDVPVGATDDASRDVTEEEIAGSLAVSSPDIDSVSGEGLVLLNTDNQHWNLVDGEEMLRPDGSPAKLEARLDLLLVDSEKMEAKVEPETSDSLSDLGKSKEVMEKLFVVSGNFVSDLQQGDREVNFENLEEARGESDGSPAKLEVRMDSHLVVSEKMEANGEPETSDCLSDSVESREVMEKFVVPENPVVDLRPGDIEVKKGSPKVECENFQAEGAFAEGSEALIKSDVIPEEIALPKLEYEIMKHRKNPSGEDSSLNRVDEVTLSTITLSSNFERKNSDVPTQSISVNQPKVMFPCLAQSESKETATANEVQTAQNTSIQDEDKQNILKMKENLSTDTLNTKSIRQLRRMFKTLSLDANANRKSNNGDKEVERKRTALQALPENRMAGSETENDA